MTSGWRFAIDRGGTFTDCIGFPPDGSPPRVVKVPSSDHAPLVGLRALLGLAASEAVPPCDVRIGTTLATNALLERRGERVALVVTRGFADLLEIGTQARPRLFDLSIRKPDSLVEAVVEVDARADPDGVELAREREHELRDSLTRLRARGIASVAVALLHSYRAPAAELRVADVARACGFTHVATSHSLAAEIGYLERTTTAVVDAYLTPVLARYVAALEEALPGSRLRFMTSSGGLVDGRDFRGPVALLSGPAGGAVAVQRLAQRLGLGPVIGFDMGGTSTDVCRVAGDLEATYEGRVADLALRVAQVPVHTVAAGGGSCLSRDDRRASVGPESTGAHPGPLSYGAAEARQLALTDANLVLGRVSDARFPFRLDTARAEAALTALGSSLTPPRDARELAAGFVEIADHTMAEAIRQVTIARGYDVREHTLIAFGGAGGQHACGLARNLGISKVVFPRHAGAFSALGIAQADEVWHGVRDAGRTPLHADSHARAARLLDDLVSQGTRHLLARGLRAQDIVHDRLVELRYHASEQREVLTWSDASDLAATFHDVARRRFGWSRDSHAIEIVAVRVRVRASAPTVTHAIAQGAPCPSTTTQLYSQGTLRRVPLVPRESVVAGSTLAGPLVVLDATATLVVDAGFTLTLHESGELIATQDAVGAQQISAPGDDQPDPVALEISLCAFASIAEQMGHVLRRTALSTNIRERLDFSCAIFDADGELVANAPHIPVHLGAMAESVRAVRRAHPDLLPGDAFVTNDPDAGGSHLPDVTVVAPVHDASGQLVFFTAARGHHADIGGITPGSMPPFSRTLDEEGVVLRALRVVHRGALDRDAVLAALAAARWPARRPLENLADLEAELGACRTGANLLLDLARSHGLAHVQRYMRFARADSARRVRAYLAALTPGARTFSDALDDGTPVCVRLEVSDTRLVVDFTGTGPAGDHNLNAPRAITVAAVIYVLRTVVGRDLPLNGGFLEPVEIVIPRGCLLDPGPGRAVAGGNVETSQRVVDVLLGALGAAAASQGTMNNLTFGDESFGYYETIAGGAGAGPTFDGASGVHTHMTNTRLTDVEVLEARFPVRVIELSLRRGSGGRGRCRGGDGVVRELELLRPLSVSILSERRASAPFGLFGGAPGLPGRCWLGGEAVGGKAAADLPRGARVRIETPGGGGYGLAEDEGVTVGAGAAGACVDPAGAGASLGAGATPADA